MTYELVAADTLNPEQVGDLRTIYEDGYAVADRAPWSRVYAHRNATEHALALLHGDVATGFAFVRTPHDADYALLRYFAIDPSRRGRSLGARFWQRICAYASGLGCRLLVWDVAAPDRSAGDTSGAAAGNGHVGIHERPDGSLVPVGEYADANGSDGPHRTVAMRLVATSLSDGSDVLDARALRRIAMDVCSQRYESAIEAPGERPSLGP